MADVLPLMLILKANTLEMLKSTHSHTHTHWLTHWLTHRHTLRDEEKEMKGR